MDADSKIDINIFKIVTRAIAESDDLGLMTGHLSQLLVSALEVKGCTLFALNPQTKELEVLASSGMSLQYMNKGPIVFDKSIGCIQIKDTIVIKDIGETDLLQYPEEAREEGIVAIVSIPILFNRDTIGALRLYHHEIWDISEQDVDSLLLLAEIIGLAMVYTQFYTSFQSIKGIISDFPPMILP